jgi:hypothetical protein
MLRMERNYSMILKQMQMAFIPYSMKEVNNDNQCVLCWENNCGCGSNTSVKNDPFINLTAEEIYNV